MPTTTNPYEARARAEKARSLADILWAVATDAGTPAADLPERVACLAQPVRDAVAGVAGEHRPSEATWEVVVDLLRDRMALVGRLRRRRARAGRRAPAS